MPRRRGAILLILVVVLVLGGVVYWEQGLRFLAEYPDVGRAPEKAGAVVVLAGGWNGERILKAGELVKAGYAPYALVSSPAGWYEVPECEAAKGFAVRRGYPEQYFVCVPMEASSTREEAAALAPAIRGRGLKKVLLVSVTTHLRRAAVLVREAAPEVEVVPVGAEPIHYRTSEWWKKREGRKAVFLEWVKLLTAPFGI